MQFRMSFIGLPVLMHAFLVANTNGEVFSSISLMEELIKIQGEMLDLFNVYNLLTMIQDERKEKISKTIENFKIEYEVASSNPAKYVGNPINSYRLIKQLYLDWGDIIDCMQLNSAETTEFNREMAKLRSSKFFPDNDDLVGSTESILRLQHTYELNTREMADGIIKGKKYCSPLNSHDCYVIGLFLSEALSYNIALEWYNIALEKFTPKELNPFDKINILDSIAYNKFVTGNISEALNLYQQIKELNPHFPNLEKNIQTCYATLNDAVKLEKLRTPYEDPHIDEDKVYLELCRERLDLPPSFTKRLKCFYLSTDSPFTKLAPFKAEKLFYRPDVVVFHDILDDSEIDHLIQESLHHLKRSEVIHHDGHSEKATARISMVRWLENDHSEIVKKINRRYQDMTGLDMKFSEQMQMADYGIGGHYSLHYDTSTRSSIFEKFTGVNFRIATLLIYLTDVEKGGNTVFPHLGISVRPRKGSAVLWYNLLLSGEEDMGTLHAACPVLLGNKWASNKWMHNQGNEFTRPCSLKYQKEGHMRNYPTLVPVPNEE